ncbi:MAG: hypothetical protein GF398_02605 [Chitinivibrionales bacterium]|nr:hypothetical protein [Chitinivibrionales bacterium]
MFKACSCGQEWDTLERFLSDEGVGLCGYFALPMHPELSAIAFNHHACKSTMAISAFEFKHMYQGPVFQGNHYHHVDCVGACKDSTNLESCPMHCECVWVREVMQIIRNWPKQNFVAADSKE